MKKGLYFSGAFVYNMKCIKIIFSEVCSYDTRNFGSRNGLALRWTQALELPDVDIDTLTDLIWTNLNEDNKVSLFVRYIDIATGETETRIVNKNA